MPRAQRLSEEEKEKILAFNAEGKRNTHIAIAIGRSESAVRRFMSRYKVVDGQIIENDGEHEEEEVEVENTQEHEQIIEQEHQQVHETEPNPFFKSESPVKQSRSRKIKANSKYTQDFATESVFGRPRKFDKDDVSKRRMSHNYMINLQNEEVEQPMSQRKATPLTPASYPSWLIIDTDIPLPDDVVNDKESKRQNYKWSSCAYCEEFNPNSVWGTSTLRKIDSKRLLSHERSRIHIMSEASWNMKSKREIDEANGVVPREMVGTPGTENTSLNVIGHSELSKISHDDDGVEYTELNESAAGHSARKRIKFEEDDPMSTSHSAIGRRNENFILGLSQAIHGTREEEHRAVKTNRAKIISDSYEDQDSDESEHFNNAMVTDYHVASDGSNNPNLAVENDIIPKWLLISNDREPLFQPTPRVKETLRRELRYEYQSCTYCAEFNPSTSWATPKWRKMHPCRWVQHETSQFHKRSEQLHSLKVEEEGEEKMETTNRSYEKTTGSGTEDHVEAPRVFIPMVRRPRPNWLITCPDLEPPEEIIDANGKKKREKKQRPRIEYCAYCAEFSPESPWSAPKLREKHSKRLKTHERSLLHKRSEILVKMRMGESLKSGDDVQSQVDYANRMMLSGANEDGQMMNTSSYDHDNQESHEVSYEEGGEEGEMERYQDYDHEKVESSKAGLPYHLLLLSSTVGNEEEVVHQEGGYQVFDHEKYDASKGSQPRGEGDHGGQEEGGMVMEEQERVETIKQDENSLDSEYPPAGEEGANDQQMSGGEKYRGGPPSWVLFEGGKVYSEKQIESGEELVGQKKRYQKQCCLYCSKLNPGVGWGVMKPRLKGIVHWRSHERSPGHKLMQALYESQQATMGIR